MHATFRNLSPLTTAAIILFTLLPLYYASYQYRIRHPYNISPFENFDHHTPHLHRPSEAEWIRSWLSTSLIHPFNPSPLATFCNQTTTPWRPNLVLNLENANGGIGNIRGNFLDFLFQAIEVGASIMLPGMATRSRENLANVWASRATLGEFFDEEWFLRVLREACPDMRIFHGEEEEGMDVLEGIWVPRSRRVDEDVEGGNSRKGLVEGLDEFLRLRGKGEGEGGRNVVVNVERRLWDVDTRGGVGVRGLRRNFGQILRVKPGIRRLSAVVVQRLEARYGVNVEIDPSDAIPKNAFFGAHLRTEADAKAVGWVDGPMTFENQTDAYIREAVKSGLGIMYVASGNSTDLERFRQKAAMHKPPVTVTSKMDLLPANEVAILEGMSWDQQALVDYEVLLRCSRFGGIVKSSFAYNIAMTRNQWLEDQGRVIDPWRVQHSEVGVAFDDGLSRIIGRDEFHEHRIPRGMWP
ncbi:hypothetical protein AC579_7778 [Pseudocercospora musae]|uniref:Alternative oxidase n=1 Tax=Pseudocercospora musae TaxID=113226 RepID=A0A139IJR5_9PEZI|nr:hypothetical protein AC579_7778 [Pseudocercospora musae]